MLQAYIYFFEAYIFLDFVRCLLVWVGFLFYICHLLFILPLTVRQWLNVDYYGCCHLENVEFANWKMWLNVDFATWKM